MDGLVAFLTSFERYDWRAPDPIAGVQLAYLSPPSDSLQFTQRGLLFGFRERHPFEHIVCFPSGASV
jgi:hypothetical protein